MNRDLQEVILIMERRHGRDVSRYHESFLAKSLQKRLLATGSQDGGAYGRHLDQNPGEGLALWRTLQNTYSEFFRDPLTFVILEQRVLPALVREMDQAERSEIRIWSAGCAAGQEAYSVAILLEDLAAEGRGGPDYRIFATDIDEGQLEAGRQGRYDQDALQKVRSRHLRAYFQLQGQALQIIPRIRARVDFSTHDLLDQRPVSPPASIYGGFDLILCSNLLFYYRPDLQRAILDKALRGLRPGGYLVTGQAERDLVEQCGALRAVAVPPPVFRLVPARR
ncbi:MAG: protein-glutamate O-methyltransferase CheR [Pseudomonadota bacterium]